MISFVIYILTQVFQLILEQYIRNEIVNIILIIVFIFQTIIIYKLYIKTESSNILSGNNMIKLFVSLAIVVSISFTKMGLLRFFYPELFVQKMTFINLGAIFATIVFYPIYEELITRGIILNKLKKKFSFSIANIIQAIIFGILHFNIYMMLFFVLFGLILGIIKKYLNIYYCIIIHVLYNMCVVLLGTQIVNLPSIPDYMFLIIGLVFLIVTFFVALNINNFIGKRFDLGNK